MAVLGILSFPTSPISYDAASDAGRSLLLVFIGLISVIGTISQFRVQQQLGNTSALISESVLRPGDHFFLTFEQELLGDTQVASIGIFLVYREEVQEKPHLLRGSGAMPRPRTFDRWIQGFTRDIEPQSPGETVSVNTRVHHSNPRHGFQASI